MSWKCTPYTSPTGHHSWVAGPTVGICYFPCGYGVSGSCSSLPPSIIWEDLTMHDSLSKTFESKIQSVVPIEFVFLCTITKLKDYEWSYHGSGPTVFTQGVMVARSLPASEYWGLCCLSLPDSIFSMNASPRTNTISCWLYCSYNGCVYVFFVLSHLTTTVWMDLLTNSPLRITHLKYVGPWAPHSLPCWELTLNTYSFQSGCQPKLRCPPAFNIQHSLY